MKILAVNMAGSSMSAVAKMLPELDLVYREGIHKQSLEKVIDFGRTKRLPRMGTLAYAGRLRELFDRGEYDLLHASGWNGGLPAFLSRRPFGLHFQGTDLREWKKPTTMKGLAKWVLQWATIHAAEYVATSTPDLEPIAKRWREDSFYMPNALDLDDFSPYGERIDHHEDSRKVALCAGRIDKTKGTPIIFDAVRRSQWVRAISLDWGIEPYYSEAKRDPPTNLRFIPLIDHREIAKHYRGIDVLLGQALIGAVGGCELEAAACGRPVVAYSKYGFPGLRHPPTVAEYADFLAAVTIYGDKRKQITEEQMRYVRENHDAATVAFRWRRIWEETREKIERA